MRTTFPKSYDRADVLMSAGCSTFVTAALIMVLPRVGTVLLEILLGMFLIGCALVARARIKRKAQLSQVAATVEPSRRSRFDRYDVVALLVVVVIESVFDGLLHRLGWSEGTRRIFPLVLLAFAILLKPRLMESAQHRRQSKRVIEPAAPETHQIVAVMPIEDAEARFEVGAGAPGSEERK
jgi:hypothetical protein